MNLASFAIQKRLVSALLTLLILASGYYAYTHLPRFEDPEFIIRSAQIITPYPGASAIEVEQEVTDVIENALQQLQGLKEVKSVSSVGLSEVTVEFTIAAAKTRSALSQKFTQLRAKISDSAGSLPPGAITPTVYDDYGDVFALYYAVTGEGYSLPEIVDYVEGLQKSLVLVPGVSKIQLIGVPDEVIYVDYKTSQLTTLGLSSQAVAQVLEGQSSVVSAGSVDAGTNRLTIRPTSAVASVEAIGDIVISGGQEGRTFRLRDIAQISRGIKEPPQKRLFRNGQPAIGMGISNTTGGNVVNMGEAVNARIAELEAQRPLGIELTAISDQSVSVRASVADFVVNVMLALAIVVGTLLIFMGLRSGLLMGAILLITVAGTLFGMYAYGLDMQRISLGALIIALGMLVDNAIVVVEGTLVRVKEGEDAASASEAVVEKTKWPLLGGTIVGILAFSAIGFSPDNTGEYAGSLFWTIAISLLFSWLVAIWLTPYLCTIFLKASKDDAEREIREHVILRGYRSFLVLCLKLRWVTVGVVVLLFVSAIGSFGLVKKGFFPVSTRAQFVVDYTLPEGTRFDRTQEDVAQIGEWVRGLGGVTGTNAIIGSGHLRFMLTYSSENTSPAYGQILVDVNSWEDISELQTQIQDHLNANYPAAISKVWKFVLGPGGGSLIEARFLGKDPVVLRGLAEKTKAIFTQAGAISVKDDWRGQAQVVRPILNEQNTRRVGLTQGDISRAIAERFEGSRIGIYRDGDDLLPIIFRPVLNDRSDLAQIRDVQIFSSVAGRYIPITQVVERFETVFENAKLRRFNRSLAIMAQADPPPGEDASAIFNEVRPIVEAIDLPEGYELVWRGEYGNSQDANAGLASTLPFGFGAMVVVVLLLFNAIRQPLIIFLTVPLAVIGVVYGLIALDTPMEFMAILGVLSLTGMMIKNAIVLIDQTDADIADGKPRLQAIMDAAVSRVRPVSLGVLTTVLGVVPLLWDPFFRSLAVVVITGLSFATVLTLVIVPVLYAIFFRVKENEGAIGSALEVQATSDEVPAELGKA
jgi:multidrug efflux pump subunit AcrB